MLRSSRGYTVSDELVVDSQPQSSDQQGPALDLPRTPSTSSLSFSHFAVSFFGSSPGPRFKCMKSDNRSGNLIRKLVLKGFCSTKEVMMEKTASNGNEVLKFCSEGANLLATYSLEILHVYALRLTLKICVFKHCFNANQFRYDNIVPNRTDTLIIPQDLSVWLTERLRAIFLLHMP
ncbi:hypothetical protein V6N13_133852 [Hibiscus sabdariffa]